MYAKGGVGLPFVHSLVDLLGQIHQGLEGKYHCTADLLFILFGFSCFGYVELASALLVLSNANQSNRRSAVQ